MHCVVCAVEKQCGGMQHAVLRKSDRQLSGVELPRHVITAVRAHKGSSLCKRQGSRRRSRMRRQTASLLIQKATRTRSVEAYGMPGSKEPSSPPVMHPSQLKRIPLSMAAWRPA